MILVDDVAAIQFVSGLSPKTDSSHFEVSSHAERVAARAAHRPVGGRRHETPGVVQQRKKRESTVGSLARRERSAFPRRVFRAVRTWKRFNAARHRFSQRGCFVGRENTDKDPCSRSRVGGSVFPKSAFHGSMRSHLLIMLGFQRLAAARSLRRPLLRRSFV